MARAAPLVLAATALVSGAAAIAFTWQPGLATFHDDSASYLVMAQAFSPWQAASASVLAQMPHEKYPPFFPLVLALSGAAFEWHWAHALVAIFFGASVWLLGLHASRASGARVAGAAAALTYAAMPGAWLNMKGILSEFPYMAITFGALAWMQARRDGTLRTRDAAGLAALLAAAMLTRTIGVTLLLAVAIAEAAAYARSRDAKRARLVAMALGAALAATALWYVVRPAAGDDSYVSSGMGVLERARFEGIGSVADLMASNLAAISSGWLNTLVIYWGEATHPRFLGAATLGLLALAGTAWRAARLQVDGLYVALFAAVLIVWPFPGQMYRLALPIYPLAMALALVVVAEIAGRKGGAERLTAYAATIPLAFCMPALFYIADRATLPNSSIMELYRIPFRPDAEASAARQAAAFLDMARIGESTPRDARVMWYGPTYIALLAGRTGVALDYPLDARDLAAQIRSGRAEYIYLSHVHPRDSAHRLGDPLAPARYLRGRAEAVWWRSGTAGDEAALFKLSPEGSK